MTYTYTINSSLSSTGPWTQVDTGITSTSDTIGSLASGTSYYFQIITFDTNSGLASQPLVVGPYVTTSAQQQLESAEGTLIVASNAATSKIYASKTYGSPNITGPFDVWGLDTAGTGGGQVVLNNTDDGNTSFVIAVYYHNNRVYQENTSLNWWYWDGTTPWVATTNPIPGTPTLAIAGIPTETTSIAFTVTGTAQTYTSTPVLQYLDLTPIQDRSNVVITLRNASNLTTRSSEVWTNLPSGSTVTLSSTNNYIFNFVHPAIVYSGITDTISVRDANTTTINTISNNFAVMAPGSSIINSVTLSNQSVASTATSGATVGTISVQTIGAAFTGTLSITGTDAAKFAISGSNLVLSSAVGSLVTSIGPAITDSFNNNWTIVSGNFVAYNGTTDSATANVAAVALMSGSIYHENTALNWYSKAVIASPIQDNWTGPVTAPSLGLTVGNYSINIVATMAGATGSPFTQAFTITSSGAIILPARVVYARDARNGWGINGITHDSSGATALNTLNCRWTRDDVYNAGTGGATLDSLVAPYGVGLTALKTAMASASLFDPDPRFMIIMEDYQQGWPNCVRSTQMPAILSGILALTASNGSKLVRMIEGPNEIGGNQGGGSVWPDGTSSVITGANIAPNGTADPYLAASGQSDAHDTTNRTLFGYWAKFFSDHRTANASLWSGVGLTSPTILDVGNGGTNITRAPSGQPGDYPSAAYPNGAGLGVASYVDNATFHYYLNTPQQTTPAGAADVNDTNPADNNQLNFDTYLQGFRHGISGGGTTMPTIVSEVGQNSGSGSGWAQDGVSAAWSNMATFLVFFANGGKLITWYTATGNGGFNWFTSYPTGVRPMGRCMANISTLLSLGNGYTNTTTIGSLAGANVTNLTEVVPTAPAFTPAYSSGFSITVNSGTAHWGNSGNYMIFPKSDGTTMIAVWREPKYDLGTNATTSQSALTAAGSCNITCNFGGSHSYNLWDPTGGVGGSNLTISSSPSKLSGPITATNVTFPLYCSPIFIELVN